MTIDKQTHLLDNLQSLLEKQIELARQGGVGDVEILTMQSDSLVAKIKQTGTLERPEFRNRREQLRKLYRDLCLAVTAQKNGVSEEISHVRKGRKTIETYRNNI